jgi:hypothetical protein
MSEIAEFVELLGKKLREETPIQTVWSTCKSVDWDNKTMVATGLVDDLDFHDVNLGIGSVYKKPKVGSKCIIGIINNKVADAFLIECGDVEEYLITDKTGFKFHLNNGKLFLNGDQFGGVVKAKEIKIQIDKNTEAIKDLQQIFNNWVPVSNDGGAALKALVTSFITKQTANLENIESTTIKHGNDVQ